MGRPVIRVLSFVVTLGAVPAAACERVVIPTATTKWFPVAMTDGDGTMTGYAVEAVRMAFDQLGIEVVQGPRMSWSRQLWSLQSGEIDVLPGAYWTQDRSETYHYLPAIAEDRIFIYGNPDKIKADTLGDLAKYMGVRPVGGSYGEALDQRLEALSFLEATQTPVIQLLSLQRADYAILAEADALLQLELYHDTPETIGPIGPPLATNPVHILMSRNSSCVGRLDDIAQALDALRADGTVEALFREAIASTLKTVGTPDADPNTVR